MTYQLDTQSSLIDVHSRFISKIFQLQDYKSYNNPTSIAKYVQRKKNSGNLNEKIHVRYPNHHDQIQTYHLRLITFFLKEGIDHVALQFIQNDCLIKPIDIKYGFNNNNHQIQVLLLKSVNQMNLWFSFSSQIGTLLSQLQPYDLFNLINTYPDINNFKIKFQNPQFVVYILKHIRSHLIAFQYSQFSSQVNDQLKLLQQSFQQLSDKESLLNLREQQLSNSSVNNQFQLLQQSLQQLSGQKPILNQKTQQCDSPPPLTSYPLGLSSISENDSNLSQTTLLNSQPEISSFQTPPPTPKNKIIDNYLNHSPSSFRSTAVCNYNQLSPLQSSTNIQKSVGSAFELRPSSENPKTNPQTIVTDDVAYSPLQSPTNIQKSVGPADELGPSSENPKTNPQTIVTDKIPPPPFQSPSKSNQENVNQSPHSSSLLLTSTTPPSQLIFTYLQNQLIAYFNDSNKTQKTKITKEVKQLLKQKTIQKNSLYQQYIDSHSTDLNQNQIKLLQKWLDISSKVLRRSEEPVSS